MEKTTWHYRGIVYDQTSSNNGETREHKTRKYVTWDKAQIASEKLLKRHYGNCAGYGIRIEDENGMEV